MRKNNFIPIFFLIRLVQIGLALTIGLLCCDARAPNDDRSEPAYIAPIQTDDGWETTAPALVNLNSQKLLDLLAHINGRQNHGVHAILIVKNGKLIFEEYFRGYLWDSSKPNFQGALVTYDRDTPHYLASVSKSVTSIVVGIATDKNLFPQSDEKIKNYYPAYASILVGEKENITIRHLLTMTSGLAWDESSTSYNNPANDVTQLFRQPDPIRYILMKPLTATPGARFHYNSGGTNVLGDLVRQVSGQGFLTFADQHLFRPLGITQYRWDLLNANDVFASGGLYLRPRDLAKLGYVFLNQGQWQGKRIISEAWIQQSITSYIHPAVGWATGYGYQWWLGNLVAGSQNYPYFLAAGWGEQYLFVFPQQDMIVVFNCGYFFTPRVIDPFQMVQNYILPALK